MVRPSQAYWAKRVASTPTWVARKRTTSGATSCLERRNRPSYCKHLSKTANPRRVAPDLLPIAANSSGNSVKCSNNSSEVHVRFMSLSFSGDGSSRGIRSHVIPPGNDDCFRTAFSLFLVCTSRVEQRKRPDDKRDSLNRRDHLLHCHHFQISAAGLASRAGALFDVPSKPAPDHPYGSPVSACSFSMRWGKNSWKDEIVVSYLLWLR
jgi:hypothetical protein